MKFEDTRPHLLTMNPENAGLFFIDFYEKRNIDLAKTPTATKIKKPKTKRKKGKLIAVTETEIQTLKKLGLL